MDEKLPTSAPLQYHFGLDTDASSQPNNATINASILPAVNGAGAPCSDLSVGGMLNSIAPAEQSSAIAQATLPSASAARSLEFAPPEAPVESPSFNSGKSALDTAPVNESLANEFFSDRLSSNGTFQQGSNSSTKLSSAELSSIKPASFINASKSKRSVESIKAEIIATTSGLGITTPPSQLQKRSKTTLPPEEVNEMVGLLTKGVIAPVAEKAPATERAPQSINLVSQPQIFTLRTDDSPGMAANSAEFWNSSAKTYSHQIVSPAPGTSRKMEEEAAASRASEERAIASIRRGAKAACIVIGVLLVFVAYQSTKVLMFKGVAQTAAAVGASAMALSIFDSQLAADKTAHSMLLHWMNASINRGHYDSALQYCNRALALDPTNSNLYLSRASIFVNLNRRQAAIPDLNMVIKLQPDKALAYNNRANVYSADGNYQAAISDFSKAIALNKDPKKTLYLVNRGSCYLQYKKYKEAIHDFDLAAQHGDSTAAKLKMATIAREHKRASGNAIASSLRHRH